MISEVTGIFFVKLTALKHGVLKKPISTNVPVTLENPPNIGCTVSTKTTFL